MKTLIRAAVVAGGLALAGLAAIQPAAAASRYGYSRPYDLARPTYVPPYPYYYYHYRPYPYYAAPFFVGFGPGVSPWGYW